MKESSSLFIPSVSSCSSVSKWHTPVLLSWFLNKYTHSFISFAVLLILSKLLNSHPQGWSHQVICQFCRVCVPPPRPAWCDPSRNLLPLSECCTAKALGLLCLSPTWGVLFSPQYTLPRQHTLLSWFIPSFLYKICFASFTRLEWQWHHTQRAWCANSPSESGHLLCNCLECSFCRVWCFPFSPEGIHML